MTDKEQAILSKAVSVIYFDDNSDYQTALWKIVRIINPEAAELLESDEQEAYKKYVKE